jgi:hypothetical protein
MPLSTFGLPWIPMGRVALRFCLYIRLYVALPKIEVSSLRLDPVVLTSTLDLEGRRRKKAT